MLKKIRSIHSKRAKKPSNKNTSLTEQIPSAKSEKFFEKKSLPKDFAEKILDLEVEMDKENINISSLRRLLELYAVKIHLS